MVLHSLLMNMRIDASVLPFPSLFLLHFLFVFSYLSGQWKSNRGREATVAT